ncbi:phasin family protein [Sphingomonas sp.]|uniref:phasin family protein n=1 Tax=Sphingomonas sp. TaxID=28214 RepID=UPI0035BC586D
MAEDSHEGIDQAANATKSATDRAANVAKDAADKMRAGAETARQTFQDKVVEPAQRAGEAMKASGQKIAEGGSNIGVKMIDQAEQNAREAFTAMREAAAAKDLSDVMRIQGDYLREQGNRSMAQAKEIGDLIMQFGRDAVAPLRGGGTGQE